MNRTNQHTKPGEFFAPVLPAPKFQMTVGTARAKSLRTQRRNTIERVKNGDGKTIKMLGIVADTANMTDDEIAKLVPPLPNAYKGIDLADIVDLRKRGLSHGAIAKVLGCSKRNIQIRLKSIVDEVDKVDSFKSHRGDLLALHQKRLLDSINKGAIDKAGLRDRVLAFGVLYDKEMHATGKGAIGDGKIQIEIINFAGASQTGRVRITAPPATEAEGDHPDSM